MRFAVVRALFNAEITSALLTGALRGFHDGRVPKKNITTYEVPGAFELPLAALWLAKTKRFDAIVCLGCVIRGQTPHFYYVAAEAARGISDVSRSTGIPVIFGVLTTINERQAWARAGSVARSTPSHTKAKVRGNKGYEAAQSAIAMAALRSSIKAR